MPECSLAAAELEERLRRFKQLTASALLESSPTPAGVRLRLRADAAVRRELDALIAAEAECCPFLSFRVDQDAAAIRLDIDGPPDARPLLDGLLAS